MCTSTVLFVETQVRYLIKCLLNYINIVFMVDNQAMCFDGVKFLSIDIINVVIQ